MGTLYGSRAAVKGAVRDLKRRLPQARLYGLSVRQIRLLSRLVRLLPDSLLRGSRLQARRRQLADLEQTIGTVEGRPIVAFLRIAYALDKSLPVMDDGRHPAKDRCGILWYAPLVPLTETGVRDYAAAMSRVLLAHGFDPLLAVTTRSSRVHSGTIPLLFARTPADQARARACYDELLRTGIAMGMPPYRLGIEYMDGLYSAPDSPSALAVKALKEAFDPRDVISPGRYARPLGEAAGMPV